MQDPESWVESLSFEELAQLKKVVMDKMDREKSTVRDQLAHDLQAKLSLYGFTASELGLTSGTPARAPRKAAGEGSGKGRIKDPTKPCPVCERATDPPHDKRQHRGTPDPFTDADLEARGMKWLEPAA
jgi:hypothetical protein